MGVSVLREQSLPPCPQGIRHTKVGRHLVHGGARASLSHLYHDLTLSHPGYPDRLLAYLIRGEIMMPESYETRFPFAHYRFHLTLLEPLEMPAGNKGSTIRGGVGSAVR